MSEKTKSGMVQLARDPKVIGGVIISMVGIYWAFRDFNFIEFITSIQRINYFYLMLATLFLWGSVWLRGIRWKWLFKDNNSPTITSLYRA